MNGADGGRLFVRAFGGDGTVRQHVAGDVLASLTTMVWNASSKSWTGGSTMANSSLNRQMTVRLADRVVFAQIGIVGLDGQIELEALRVHGLPEAAPALLCGTPTLPVGQREFTVETPLDLPSLAPGAVHLVDVAVAGARQGDRAEASLASSTRFIELDAFVWSNYTVRVLARNVSGAAFDLAPRPCRSQSRSGGCPEPQRQPSWRTVRRSSSRREPVDDYSDLVRVQQRGRVAAVGDLDHPRPRPPARYLRRGPCRQEVGALAAQQEHRAADRVPHKAGFSEPRKTWTVSMGSSAHSLPGVPVAGAPRELGKGGQGLSTPAEFGRKRPLFAPAGARQRRRISACRPPMRPAWWWATGSVARSGPHCSRARPASGRDAVAPVHQSW